MMPTRWKPTKGRPSAQDDLPAERKVVLCWLEGQYLPYCGYIRYSAGDRECPYWVVYTGSKGRGGQHIIAWSDCLPANGPDWLNVQLYAKSQAQELQEPVGPLEGEKSYVCAHCGVQIQSQPDRCPQCDRIGTMTETVCVPVGVVPVDQEPTLATTVEQDGSSYEQNPCAHEFPDGTSAVAESSGCCVKCSWKVGVSLTERVAKLEKILAIVVRCVQTKNQVFSSSEVDEIVELMKETD